MWAVIRIRGTVNVSPSIKKTLELLKLLKPHQMVLVDERKELKQMVLKAQEYLAFGEISEETFEDLLAKRARLAGDKRLLSTDKKNAKAKEIAKEVLAGKKKLKDFGVKEVFRLNSPKKGFERGGVKKSFKTGGAVGYRGKEINELLYKMM